MLYGVSRTWCGGVTGGVCNGDKYQASDKSNPVSFHFFFRFWFRYIFCKNYTDIAAPGSPWGGNINHQMLCCKAYKNKEVPKTFALWLIPAGSPVQREKPDA